MEHMGPSWVQIAERARNALEACTTVQARVHCVAPVTGTRGEPVESMLEVAFARPDMWRVDRDGDLVLLRDGTRQLVRSESGLIQRIRREDDWVPGDQIGGLGWGNRDMFRDPPAFQTALTDPEPVVVGGRDAFEVRLAAPGKKPYALRLAVDTATGLVLRFAAEGTPYFTEVLELAVNEALPTDRFAWAGEYEDRRRPEEDSGRRSKPSLDAAERVARVRDQLEIITALVAALERRAEAWEVIEQAGTVDGARTALAALLGVTEVGATAILDMQVRRVTRDERAKITTERDRLSALLEELGAT